MPCAERLLELLSMKKQFTGDIDIQNIETVEIQDLSFKYDSQSNMTIDNFSHIFKKGNIYLFTGINGCGKSTIINLIIGLYNNEYSGHIFINGIDQKYINMKKLRRNKISVCEQEPILIDGCFFDNVSLFETIDTKLKIEYLKKVFHLDDMNVFRKECLEFQINEQNSNLSGGEKQMVAILRSLCKNSDLIILDEPSSALDKSKLIYLKNYLKKISKDKIIIVVSHNETFSDIANETIKVGGDKFER